MRVVETYWETNDGGRFDDQVVLKDLHDPENPMEPAIGYRVIMIPMKSTRTHQLTDMRALVADYLRRITEA